MSKSLIRIYSNKHLGTFLIIGLLEKALRPRDALFRRRVLIKFSTIEQQRHSNLKQFRVFIHKINIKINDKT